MSENVEKKEPVVNEEYEEQETAEDSCCLEEESHSCCCDHIDDESSDKCSCTKDPELEALQKRLEEAEARQDEYLRDAQRLQAEFDNYKRRSRIALADAHQAACADVVEAFLPVLDNLDRAIESITAAGADESILKGIELVRRQFLDTLSRLEVEEIDAIGKPFDPELHNAVGQVEAEEGQEENTVVMVLQKGYKMGGRVIRYSMVQVAR